MTRLDRAIDAAAAELASTSRAFTRGNLYHAVLRTDPGLGARWTLDRFCREPLARRLRRGRIPGLLPASRPRRFRAAGVANRREWDACFPAAILLVDRPEIVDLFAASGALVQSRIAAVCTDGTPAHVVSWLRRGIRLGHTAPVGYLHDAGTVLYPFFFEPLATLVAVSGGRELRFRDLGIGPGRPLRDLLGVAAGGASSAVFLEQIPPCALVAYAAQELLRLVSPDPLLLPMRTRREKSR